MNSCKRSPHRHLRYEAENQHRCNRLTTKMHFNKGPVLAVVAFVAVLIFSYQNQVLAEETTVVHQEESTIERVTHIPEIKPNMVKITKVVASENNSTNVELNIESLNTTTAVGFASTQQPDQGKHTLQAVVDVKFYSALEHTTDINNDIFSNIEENPKLRISSDSPNVHDSYPVSTENLEESIRNSVKSEMELEQNLELSPVLEILKELPEPEIRKTLTADIMSLDQKNFADNAMLLKVNEEVIKDTSESIIKMPKSDMKNKTTKDAGNWEVREPKTYNNELNPSSAPPSKKIFKTKEIFVQLEPISEIRNTTVAAVEKLVNNCIEHKTTTGAKCLEVQESNSVTTENSEESSNLENGESSLFKTHSHKNFTFPLFSSLESNSSKNSEDYIKKKKKDFEDQKSVENIDHNQSRKTPCQAKTSESNSSKNAENFFENVYDSTDTKLNQNIDKTSSENVDLTIPETSHKLHSQAMFNMDESGTLETKDDVLSVALNETHSATLLNPTVENCVNNLDTRGIATFNDNITAENTDAALSVVLNETISANLQIPGDENPFSIEEKQNLSLNLMREEEIEKSTAVLGEFEHVVIKKVLNMQEIYDNIVETTVIPLAQKNDLKSKFIEEQRVVVEDPVVKQFVYDDLEYENKLIDTTEREIPQDEKTLSSKDENENYKKNKLKLQLNHVLPKCDENIKTKADAKNAEEIKYEAHPYEILVPEVQPSTIESRNKENTALQNYTHIVTTTASSLDAEVKLNSKLHIVDSFSLEGVGHSKNVKGSRLDSSEIFLSQHVDDSVAALFETYPPQNAGQTLNDNLADEYAGIGKALPISIKDESNRSIIIIVLSSGTAFLFIVISVTIFLISFQRQHGTLDIEMQERSCGKDDLDEEDAETFAKLLDLGLPSSVAITLDETEECL